MCRLRFGGAWWNGNENEDENGNRGLDAIGKWKKKYKIEGGEKGINLWITELNPLMSHIQILFPRMYA